MGMTIKKDQRPRDWGYIARFRAEDLPAIRQMISHIRQTHDTAMIEELNARLESGATELQNGIKILSVTKSQDDDLMVNAGIQQCINIMLGTSSARWSHIATGISTATASVSDTAVASETGVRVALATDGWAEAVGMKIIFGGVTEQERDVSTAPPATIRNVGVLTASSGGTLLNHEVFSNNPISREFVINLAGQQTMKTVAIISCVIEFCPVR